jgi:hypothetical protein
MPGVMVDGSQVKVTLRLTVSQSVNLSVEPHQGSMAKYSLLFDSYGLVLWGALSDERTVLSFVCAADPRQRSLSWVRVSWDSRPYITVSVLRLQGGSIRPRLHTGVSRSKKTLNLTH